ncbi:MAG: hypothetical protein IT581_17500 [Verrucomicrobiales bacterium]|nr:hypothetical protein [Verrucomicrobiales bacterium]
MSASIPGPVLVCFAVPQEAAPLRRMPHQGLTLRVTGMGPANARAAILQVLEQSRPRFVLTCGFAGGLRPDLQTGRVVFDADEDSALDAALNRTTAARARFHCANRIAVLASEKAHLRSTTDADVVEMESGVIREICLNRQIPSATIRSISDAAAEDLPLDFNRLLTARQDMHWGRLMLALARKPTAIPGLMRMQKQCTFAARQLADVILAVARDPALSLAK